MKEIVEYPLKWITESLAVGYASRYKASNSAGTFFERIKSLLKWSE